ncbi:MAG: TetR/AcrR family transcriptional regulator [Acidimicrobiia bacterium]|nr:TetR/AcrR family transcriptional regulator [Acidimicrobiia bacterium]
MSRATVPQADEREATRAGSERRREVLLVAAAVIARKGVHGATVRDIADEAGILSGSLYHHFSSKEQMVDEIVTAYLGAAERRFDEVVARCGDDAARGLADMIRAGVAGVAAEPDQARIVRHDGHQLALLPAFERIAERRRTLLGMWQAMIAAGISQGVFRADLDVDITARAITDAVLSSGRWLPPEGELDVDTVASHLNVLFIEGLRQR